MKKIRLQKYLAKQGINSRRKCEKMIRDGFVKVNNSVVTKLGTCIDPLNDIVEIDDIKIDKSIDNIYILLNKPRGYLCTHDDSFGRPTIYDLIKNVKTKVNYAGRLDYLSEGLVLLTNDGDLIFGLTHPKKKVEKVYIAKVKGFPDIDDLTKFEKGIALSPTFVTSPSKANILEKDKKSTTLKVSIREGKKRQIRRMFLHLGFPVIRLKRIKIGPLSLGTLKTGHYRYLKSEEIQRIKHILSVF